MWDWFAGVAGGAGSNTSQHDVMADPVWEHICAEGTNKRHGEQGSMRGSLAIQERLREVRVMQAMRVARGGGAAV